jgi:hypothetical protein
MFFRYDIFMPETQEVTPAVQIPSAQEMEDQVSQVPQTEAAPPIDQQTQSPFQTTITPEQQAFNNGIALANTPETEDFDAPVNPTEKVVDSMAVVRKWAVKGIGVALTLQGIHGIYKSVIFILVDYPLLEQQLISHQITQDQVNDFGIRAIMMVISTILSMFFALQITVLRIKAFKSLKTAVSILLIFTNVMIHDYFASLNSSQYMIDTIINVIHFLQGAPEEVIEKTPFLEETIEGTIDTVWYK